MPIHKVSMNARKITVSAPVYLAESFAEHAATILNPHLHDIHQLVAITVGAISPTVKVAFAISAAETFHDDDVLDTDLEAHGINPDYFDTLPVQKLTITGTIQTSPEACQDAQNLLEQSIGALDELLDVTLQDIACGKAAGFRLSIQEERVQAKTGTKSALRYEASREAAQL